MDFNLDQFQLDELDRAVTSWEFAGPGTVDGWEPGLDVDYDLIAKDILEIAIALVRGDK